MSHLDPAAGRHGPQTALALQNFPLVHTEAIVQAMVKAIARVKVATARANARTGRISDTVAEAIVRAATEVAANAFPESFPLPLVQGGGGTSLHMNVNEVIADRATELLGSASGESVYALGHVNASQSTNDVYPTALAIAVINAAQACMPVLDDAVNILESKATEWWGFERLGRTCLRDALPVPAGSLARAAASGLRRTSDDLQRALSPLHEVPIGATAVGTGAGASVDYRAAVIEELAAVTGLPLVRAVDPFDSLSNLDPYASVASALARVMLVLAKLAADIRFLGLGPLGGIGELRVPTVQAGSTQMPGKVNPVIPELVIQSSFEVRGAAAVVEYAVAAGELELNVMEPVIAKHLLQSLNQVAAITAVFTDRCLVTLEWDRAVLEKHLAGSLLDAVAQSSAEGYDASG